ncbi:hypothetical protein B0J11DRAFT_584394 [Dendryphion nanum]|uniref:Uncharacterized protein n=1 Tax=Dendryphion nanum TaxID=256645 RepID=A0A9P9D9K0_9PLEO|nr:hypothetical protein B0J11DRAFT_584394 [Dendryphion nanum]
MPPQISPSPTSSLFLSNEPSETWSSIIIPNSVALALAIGGPFVIVIGVISLLWCHYSRQNRRDAKKKLVEQQKEREKQERESNLSGDEEAHVGFGGKAELACAGQKDEEEGLRCELEQPPMPEKDGEAVFEMYDGWGLGGELEGMGKWELEGCRVPELESPVLEKIDSGIDEDRMREQG